MKRLFVCISVVTMICVIVTTSYGEQFWIKTYGGSSLDDIYSIQQTLDEGYILVGHTDYFIVDNIDCWVLKLDNNGNIIWQKIYYRGESSNEWGLSIQQTSDEGYIMAGLTYASSPPFEVWVLKLDSNGNIVWQKNFERIDAITTLQSIQQTSDGGYIVAGYTEILGNAELWILKLGSNGDVIWQKTYGGSSSEAAQAIQQTLDGGYIVSGTTSSFGAGDSDVWILRLDSNGNILWQKTYGVNNGGSRTLILETSDGKYILAGGTISLGAGLTDIWVLKFEANGDVIWQKTYGGSEHETIYSINLTADGGYVVAGATESFSEIYQAAWMFKLDGNGAIAWQKTYKGGTYVAEARSIQQTTNQGYIIAGVSGDPSETLDVWVMNLDSNGEIFGCDMLNTSNALVIDTFQIGQNTDATVQSTSFPATSTSFISQHTTVEPSTICCYDVDDYDCDYILNPNDNCPNDYNPDQEDTYPPHENGIGDACDCECDFDCNGTVDANDVTPFLADFGRNEFNDPCTNESPCNGDVDCSGSCDATDVTAFLEDFGRNEFNNPCPVCVAEPWCEYEPSCQENYDCISGFFCMKPIGECNALGECSPIPEVCTYEYFPVCGCDANTYGNICIAFSVGISVDYFGECS